MGLKRLRTKLRSLIVAFAFAGCGLTMTRGPDAKRPPDQRPTCTDTFDAPKRDAYGAVAGFLGLLVGALFYKVGTSEDAKDTGAVLLLGGAVVMAGSYASGGIGYYRIKDCRKAIRAYERRRR